MAVYVHDSQFFTRRGLVFIAIIALHVFILWALATGLARKAIEVLAPPIQTEIVQEEVKQNQPPPPPPPQMEKPPVEVPPPDVVIDMPVEAPATSAITAVAAKPNAAPPPPPRAAGPSSPPKAGKGFPNSEDYYPDASKRMNEEGMAVVHACVGGTGKLTEAPTVSKSSGSPRLDQAAIKLATAGSGHFQPALQDGKPVDACFDFGVRFKLRQ